MRLSSGRRWEQAKYGFVGLLGGNAAWLLLLLVNAIRIRSELLALHVGLVSGPVALFLIFAILTRGHVKFAETYTSTSWLWLLSMLISTAAFWLYASLLRGTRSNSVFTAPSKLERLAD
jgi:membrane-bound ClpP family serine protease